MKRNLIIVFASFILFNLFTSCESTDVEERPLWTDSYTVNQVFPSDRFITGIGRAESAETAQSFSDAEIASYFSREISSKTTALQYLSSDEEMSKINENLVREIQVKSQIDIAGVKHTKPWFDKKERLYYVCAYINRNEAWKNFEPVIFQSRQEFYAYLKAAENEDDVFRRIEILNEALKFSVKYEEKILFSELLNRAASKEFSDDRIIIASLGERISSLRGSISFKVILEDDSDFRFKKKIENVITKNGFTVTEKKSDYIVNVAVFSEKQKFEDTIVAFPEVNIEICTETKTVFSFKKTLSRVSGFLEAEKLLDSKILRLEEEVIDGEFSALFSDYVR